MPSMASVPTRHKQILHWRMRRGGSATAAGGVATTVKTTSTMEAAAVEAAVMSKIAVIELHMMAVAVMFFPRMVDDEAGLIAPGISPTPCVWRIAIGRVIGITIDGSASAHRAGDQGQRNEHSD